MTDAQYAELAARTCLAQVEADVRYYTTVYAMDDVDAVRSALGYDKVDLYGGSYGATAAQVYMERHADRTRVAVLSGASLLSVPMFQTWARHAQEALDAVLGRCAADTRCATAYPDIAGAVPKLLAQLATAPITVPFGATTVTVTSESFAGTV